MKLFDGWLYRKVRDMWDNSYKYTHYLDNQKEETLRMNSGSQLKVSMPEGEDRISFDLTTAVGGRILNVRRYDSRTDRHDSTTYVIPAGEDVGSRVTKIINLELIK